MSKVLVIAGMHRSGTSLLANLMGKVGVFLGDRLRPAHARFNPEGYWEDEDFVSFHDDVLADNGTSWYLENLQHELKINPAAAQRGRELVDARAEHAVWGWKDPRTTLFLDFWRETIPKAKFLLVFRRAEEVVDSLRRRGDKPLKWQFRGAWLLSRLGFSTFRRSRAIDLWLAYNRAMVRFARAHAECVRVLDLDHLDVGLPKALDVMREQWGFEVRDADTAQVFKRDLLSKSPAPAITSACRRRQDVQTLYAELQELAAY